jgi:hypothetical protein
VADFHDPAGFDGPTPRLAKFEQSASGDISALAIGHEKLGI